jgi:hypothetical protein
MPECSHETTDLLHPLTPGMTIGETSLSTQTEDDGLLAKLADLLEKGQTAKMLALLEKAGVHKENTDTPHTFKLAG